MAFKIAWLWTDILLWFLVIAVIISILLMRRDQQWRSAWQQVLHSRQGVISGIVLLTFVMIGLLDSIHLHFTLPASSGLEPVYDSSSLSVLDLILSPLGQEFEETYSAPFALHLFVKKMVLTQDNTYVLDYPRLLWAGTHLSDASQRAANIAVITSYALGKAGLIWIGIIGCTWWYQTRKINNGREAWHKIWHNPKKSFPYRAALITIGIILAVILICKNLAAFYHIMGTDKIGTDVFYLGIKSIRTGLIMGTVTTLFMLPVALLAGMVAGYFSGWLDDMIQYIYSVVNAIPSILLIAAAALVLQLYITQHEFWFPSVEQRADARLLMLCIVLGLTNWTTLCRLLRGETLKLRESDYILAARTLGVSARKILWRHILPNVMHIVIVIVVLDFSAFVLAEAVLSYIGVGVDPATASWGNMINRARLELARDPAVWWSLATAFVLMFLLVLSANLFADKVRDAFDPKLKQV